MTSTFAPEIQQAFTQLGQYLRSSNDDELKELIQSAKHYNAWFTPAQTEKAVKGVGAMLNEKDISTWFETERITRKTPETATTVGLVLAGNIPLVGFHDILCVLASGNTALIKLSSQNQHLTPFLLNKLTGFEPSLATLIRYTERLQDFGAVIATGSNNTSRYFEYYFKKVPHIIRRNRNSIAILSGNETSDDLKALGHDIFDYFGLGCRNVSKLYVPQGYVFNKFFEAIEPFSDIINHHKYNNNYDYNKSIYLVNREPHLDNGFLLVRKTDAPTTESSSTQAGSAGLSSTLATLYYEEYQDIESLKVRFENISEEIQCIAGHVRLPIPVQQVNFGETQSPRLWDYADGMNTIQFLLSL